MLDDDLYDICCHVEAQMFWEVAEDHESISSSANNGRKKVRRSIQCFRPVPQESSEMLLEQPLPYRPFELADRLSCKELFIDVVSESPLPGQLIQTSRIDLSLTANRAGS